MSRTVAPGRREGLVRFGSGAELKEYLASISRRQRSREATDQAVAPAADGADEAEAAPAEEDADEESITNTQEAGVDEGGS